jgi:hypothetical protein
LDHAQSPSAALRLQLWHPRNALCAVCRQRAHGFGWSEPWRTSRPRPSVWFCSITCQRFFGALARRSTAMIDLTQQEQAAIRATVQLIAEIMEEIGWHTRLSELTEQQVLTLIEVAVGGFQDAMRETAENASPEVPF